MWTKPLLSRRNSGNSAGKFFVHVRLQCVLRNRLTDRQVEREERENYTSCAVIHYPVTHPRPLPLFRAKRDQASMGGE